MVRQVFWAPLVASAAVAVVLLARPVWPVALVVAVVVPAVPERLDRVLLAVRQRPVVVVVPEKPETLTAPVTVATGLVLP
jgi:hypothetical protein